MTEAEMEAADPKELAAKVQEATDILYQVSPISLKLVLTISPLIAVDENALCNISQHVGHGVYSNHTILEYTVTTT